MCSGSAIDQRQISDLRTAAAASQQRNGGIEA
jgi:hypothetical protein